jgi:hypothetical protein
MRALVTILCTLALAMGGASASAQDVAPAENAAPAPATVAPEPAPEVVAPVEPAPIVAPVEATPELAYTEPVPAPTLMTVELNAGLGIGTRSYERPNGAQAQALESAPFTALDLSLRMKRCTSDCRAAHYAIELLLRYQTSLGMKVEQPLIFALPSEVDARSSRLELSLAPIFRLAEHISLAVPIGASMRALQAPHRDLPLPSYLLFGPHLRVEARAALGESFALRAGPELQWIAMVGERLQNDGTEGGGVAVGFELAASASLTSCLGLELTYRQAHAFVSGQGGRADFEDTERYATLQLSGRL